MIAHPDVPVLILVRTRRIELPLPCGNRLLRPARLPVPPRPRWANLEDTNSRGGIQEGAVGCRFQVIGRSVSLAVPSFPFRHPRS